MVAAVHIGNNGAKKVSVGGLSRITGDNHPKIISQPMGLSIVSKLSPKNITALMMGGWF
jgi:POT family proton-dependent oligopeptide transporter